MTEDMFYSMSYIRQMAEIAGEVLRIVRRGLKERIKENKDYKGEPQVIEHLFDMIKCDPKNAERLPEIKKAECGYLAYMNDEPNAPTDKELSEYWNCCVQAYVSEIEMDELHSVSRFSGRGFFIPKK